MPSPLFALPPNELLCIMKKMTPKSLNRLRRTNKSIDSVLEENRNEFFCSANNDRLVFSININEEAAVSYKIAQHYTEVKMTDEMKHTEIWDPFKQLAHLRFQAVVLVFNHNDEEDKRFKRNPKVLSSYAQNVKPLIRKMKLFCNHFAMIARILSFDETAEELISIINFSKLFIACETGFSLLLNPRIQECVKAQFFLIDNIPDDISSVLRYCNVPTVTLRGFVFNSLRSPLQSFLQTVARDSGAKGCIEQCTVIDANLFEIISESTAKLFLTRRVEVLFWQSDFSIRTVTMHFFQMKVKDGGMAIISIYEDVCKIDFLSDDSRESIFNAMAPNLFFRTPFDVSSLFDDFLETEDIGEAFQNLLSVYK